MLGSGQPSTSAVDAAAARTVDTGTSVANVGSIEGAGASVIAAIVTLPDCAECEHATTNTTAEAISSV